MSYCEYIKTTTGWAIDLNKTYHDEKYGFPIEDDNELFGRLLLEINQAGLSWSTILKKETAFRTAYDNFNIETIANYTETDEARLLADPGIIRNRLKVKAAIHNAQAIMELKMNTVHLKTGWITITLKPRMNGLNYSRKHSNLLVGRSSMNFC